MPTVKVDLPSKGLVYAKSNPLSSGSVEMRYPGAWAEDIMANESYIEQGIVFDKLVPEIITSDIDYNDLVLGDKNQLFVASRILTFGKDYHVNYILPGDNKASEITIDLTTIKDKVVDYSIFQNKNEFDFVLPICEAKITFKLLTHKDEKAIDQEVEALKKISPDLDKSASVTWYYTITSINGAKDTATIRDFVNNGLITLDSDKLRQYMSKIAPNVDFKFDYTKPNGEVLEGLPFSVGRNFFRSPAIV